MALSADCIADSVSNDLTHIHIKRGASALSVFIITGILTVRVLPSLILMPCLLSKAARLAFLSSICTECPPSESSPAKRHPIAPGPIARIFMAIV